MKQGTCKYSTYFSVQRFPYTIISLSENPPTFHYKTTYNSEHNTPLSIQQQPSQYKSTYISVYINMPLRVQGHPPQYTTYLSKQTYHFRIEKHPSQYITSLSVYKTSLLAYKYIPPSIQRTSQNKHTSQDTKHLSIYNSIPLSIQKHRSQYIIQLRISIPLSIQHLSQYITCLSVHKSVSIWIQIHLSAFNIIPLSTQKHPSKYTTAIFSGHNIPSVYNIIPLCIQHPSQYTTTYFSEYIIPHSTQYHAFQYTTYSSVYKSIPLSLQMRMSQYTTYFSVYKSICCSIQIHPCHNKHTSQYTITYLSAYNILFSKQQHPSQYSFLSGHNMLRSIQQCISKYTMTSLSEHSYQYTTTFFSVYNMYLSIQ